VIKRDRLDHAALTKGQIFREGLNRIAEHYSFLGDIRGRGLMIGVEVVKPDGSTDGALSKAIRLSCFNHGLIIETGGRNSAVLRFIPALTVSEAEIGEILERFEQACGQACRKMSTEKINVRLPLKRSGLSENAIRLKAGLC